MRGVAEQGRKFRKKSVFKGARQQNMTLSHWERASNPVWRCHPLTASTQIKISHFFSSFNTHPVRTVFQLPSNPETPTLPDLYLSSGTYFTFPPVSADMYK